MTGGVPDERPIPATEHAIQIVEAGRVVHNRDKAVPQPGPYQVLMRTEACGLCFSDTKLLHAFTSHPRKGPVLSGLDAEVLAEIPSYTPGRLFTVPGHEAVGRIVAVGGKVRRHSVGESFTASAARRKVLTIKMSRRMNGVCPESIRLVETGLVNVWSVVRASSSLDQYRPAFESAAAREGLKQVLRP